MQREYNLISTFYTDIKREAGDINRLDGVQSKLAKLNESNIAEIDIGQTIFKGRIKYFWAINILFRPIEKNKIFKNSVKKLKKLFNYVFIEERRFLIQKTCFDTFFYTKLLSHLT